MHLDIPELRVDNRKIWKARILLHLGYIDIDYAIRKSEPLNVIPEKFQFMEKGQNHNFGYKIVISVKNSEFIL